MSLGYFTAARLLPLPTAPEGLLCTRFLKSEIRGYYVAPLTVLSKLLTKLNIRDEYYLDSSVPGAADVRSIRRDR